MSCHDGFEMFAPWNCTAKACVKSSDCGVNGLGENISRAMCVKNMDYFTEFPSVKFVQYCVCDLGMGFTGSRCEEETVVTQVFRWLRIVVMVVEAGHLMLALLTLIQARKHKLLRCRPLWVSLCMAVFGLLSHMMWTLSVIVMSVGDLSDTVLSVARNALFVVVPATTFFLLLESLITSFSWLEILEPRSSSWIVVGGRIKSIQMVFILALFLLVPMAFFFSQKKLREVFIASLPFLVLTSVTYIIVLVKVNGTYRSVELVEKDIFDTTVRSGNEYQAVTQERTTNSNTEQSEDYDVIRPFWSCFGLWSVPKMYESSSADRLTGTASGREGDVESGARLQQSSPQRGILQQSSFRTRKRRKQTSYLLQSLEQISGAAVTMNFALALLLVGSTASFFVLGQFSPPPLLATFEFLITLGILLVHVSVVIYARNSFVTTLTYRQHRIQQLEDVPESVNSTESRWINRSGRPSFFLRR